MKVDVVAAAKETAPVKMAEQIKKGLDAAKGYRSQLRSQRKGTGAKEKVYIKDYENIKGGETIEDILDIIPDDAIYRELIPQEGKVQAGFEYKWTNEVGHTIRIRVHGQDSTNYNPNAVNKTHIPVKSPQNGYSEGMYKK